MTQPRRRRNRRAVWALVLALPLALVQLAVGGPELAHSAVVCGYVKRGIAPTTSITVVQHCQDAFDPRCNDFPFVGGNVGLASFFVCVNVVLPSPE